jgi:hypothetical protein
MSDLPFPCQLNDVWFVQVSGKQVHFQSNTCASFSINERHVYQFVDETASLPEIRHAHTSVTNIASQYAVHFLSTLKSSGEYARAMGTALHKKILKYILTGAQSKDKAVLAAASYMQQSNVVVLLLSENVCVLRPFAFVCVSGRHIHC